MRLQIHLFLYRFVFFDIIERLLNSSLVSDSQAADMYTDKKIDVDAAVEQRALALFHEYYTDYQHFSGFVPKASPVVRTPVKPTPHDPTAYTNPSSQPSGVTLSDPFLGTACDRVFGFLSTFPNVVPGMP
jgi:hypothetical protein